MLTRTARIVRPAVGTVNHVQKRGFFRIIHQNTVGYREFLGMNRVRLEPGIRIKLPFFHTLKVVDLRENSMPISNIVAYTKDNVPVHVGGSLFYKVKDAEKACYGVQNYQRATYNVGESTIRAIIGKFEYDKITAERNHINTDLVATIGTSIENWGVECGRFEVQDFGPQNKEIAHQLEKQMEAERSKRANVLATDAAIKTAEGKKQTAILESEGVLTATENKAKADLVMAQRVADGKKYEIDTVTEAVKRQLEEVGKMFGGNTDKAATYLLEQSRIKNLGAIANGPNKATYFMPSDSVLPMAKVAGDLFGTK